MPDYFDGAYIGPGSSAQDKPSYLRVLEPGAAPAGGSLLASSPSFFRTFEQPKSIYVAPTGEGGGAPVPTTGQIWPRRV